MNGWLAVGQVDRVRPLLAVGQPVPQPDVRERAAHHDLVVAAPGAVRVELERRRRRAAWSHWPAGDDGAIEPAGRDVVGRDRVAEDGEDAGARRCRGPARARRVRPSKNGGLAMYVEPSSQA